MSKKPSCYNQCIKLLHELHKEYPSIELSVHIDTALAEYDGIWGISDKELLFALEKYKSEMEFNTVPEKEIEKIIEEGKNLETMFKSDEDLSEDYI